MTPSGPPPQPPAQPPGGPGTPVSGPPAAFAGFGKPPLDGATAVHDPVREVRTGVLVALAVAVLLVSFAHVFMRKTAKAHGWIAPIAINFIVGCAVLAAAWCCWGATAAC